ncbi:MAG: amidase domain-containing protein [Candidatus Epulonipiscioides saccharophilum]|nr:MAG: amidase domain-containing protein [Epulopiscium sp. AS2M-Bin001]
MKKYILRSIILLYFSISGYFLKAYVCDEIDLDGFEKYILEKYNIKNDEDFITQEDKLQIKFEKILSKIIEKRNNYILYENYGKLENLYDITLDASRHAFEHEAIKTEYLKNWASKQGVTFTNISSEIKIKKIKDCSDGLYNMTFNVCTTYEYLYNNEPEKINKFKLGTLHYIHLQKENDEYKILQEWYTDPFSDSLELKTKETDEHTQYLMSQIRPEFIPSEYLAKAIEYAHNYCGLGPSEHMFEYNKNYIDCNPVGGDCANFASQIMYESGIFEKNDSWNYINEGTTNWINAQGFSFYLLKSGRASLIDKGVYEVLYKSAFKMRPGDIVAYEKDGRIIHVSTVSALDSKGYPLVTCHNTDRLIVPYDLGWSNSNIIFYLIDVHY